MPIFSSLVAQDGSVQAPWLNACWGMCFVDQNSWRRLYASWSLQKLDLCCLVKSPWAAKSEEIMEVFLSSSLCSWSSLVLADHRLSCTKLFLISPGSFSVTFYSPFAVHCWWVSATVLLFQERGQREYLESKSNGTYHPNYQCILVCCCLLVLMIVLTCSKVLTTSMLLLKCTPISLGAYQC